MHFDPDFIVLRNSIVAGNTAGTSGPDCNLRMRSEGGTLLGSTAGCQLTGGPGDQLNVDPRLDVLRRLAPRAWAHPLLQASPAIDAGANALCTAADQIGTTRPYDGDGDRQGFLRPRRDRAGTRALRRRFRDREHRRMVLHPALIHCRPANRVASSGDR